MAFGLAAALVAGGCVSSGTHRSVVAERDRLADQNRLLEQRVERLEASSESLDKERAALIDELEGLRQAHDELDRDVRRLRQAEAQLTENLEKRNAELAKRTAEVDRLRSTYEGLVEDLEAEVAAGQIEIEQLRDGLRLNLSQEVLFPSGSAEVNESGRVLLAKVSERLKELPHQIVVRGHTDNVPIRSRVYPTNWELAGARASRVVRLLVDRGIEPARLSAVSLGEWSPRASNDTPEGRAKNRRIEITLQPAAGAAAVAPGGSAAAPGES